MALCGWPLISRSLLLLAGLSSATVVKEEAPLNAHGSHARHLALSVHRKVTRAQRLRQFYAAENRADTFTLRVCNAYAFGSAVDIFKGEAPHFTEKLTRKTGPLPFKQCVDLPDTDLQPGEKLEFMVGGDLHLGTFAVTHLPEGPLMQLVIYRHDEITTAASFSSHVFDESYAPQIAVVDTYIGPSRAKLSIQRDGDARDQPVHPQRVISIDAGTYRLNLQDSMASVSTAQAKDTKDIAAVKVHAESYGRYTAIRTGIKAFHGPSFDEDLIIFPGGQAVASFERSGAAGRPPHSGAAATVLGALGALWALWAA